MKRIISIPTVWYFAIVLTVLAIGFYLGTNVPAQDGYRSQAGIFNVQK